MVSKMGKNGVGVLVTGGGGFIGSHLVQELVGSGYEVGVLDDFSAGDESNLAPVRQSVKLHRGDIADREFVKDVIRGYEMVVHQAARVSVTRSVEDPAETNRRNTDGTLNLLVASKDEGVERFVYASSSSVYGETQELPKVETMEPHPVSPYAVSKLAAENYCRVFSSVYGLKTVSLRYFNVYGPRQKPGPYGGAIPAFFKKALSGEPPIIYGDGTQTRDFTYVKDVVQANLLCLEKPLKGGEVYNVGSGKRISVNELARLVCRLAGQGGLEPVHMPQRAGDVMHSLADISKISHEMGYKPSYTMEAGLGEVADWFRGTKTPA
jgi:nucleoside-diphosphate-sugar epimerase